MAECVDDSPAPTVPPADWDLDVRVCDGATFDAGCEVDETCAPRVDASALVCIHRQGLHECPATYPDRSVFHDTFTDSRACTTCTCGENNPTCIVDIEVCSVNFFDLSIASGQEVCLPGDDGQDFGVNNAQIVTPASCTASGGRPIGQAATAGPRTVCCP